jgi:hypothetical protein
VGVGFLALATAPLVIVVCAFTPVGLPIVIVAIELPYLGAPVALLIVLAGLGLLVERARHAWQARAAAA